MVSKRRRSIEHFLDVQVDLATARSFSSGRDRIGDHTAEHTGPPERHAVECVDDTVARLRATGAELVGEVAQDEDNYSLCYTRGPAGIIVALVCATTNALIQDNGAS